MNVKIAVKEFTLITIGTAIIAAAVFFFAQPLHLTLGSVSGLAIILENLLPLRMSTIALILNAGLLLFGFLLIGREFGAKTIYTSLLLPVLLGLFERLFPNNLSLTGDAFIDMVCYLFVVSLGQSILFARNASSGGLDIVGKIMNKFLRMDIGKSISLVGMCIALSSAFVFDKKIVVISVLGTYLNGMVLDHFIFGSNIKRRVCIISAHQDKIVDYVLNTLHSGATLYEAKGAYTNSPISEVIVIVNKQEYRLLMDFIAKTDPKAFVTIYNVNEVVYQPKVLTK
ncbi:MAG: YitT family protein [Ruminococcaceae bacterium]|nr:YitT family protein [Oscillospiraceae bacterium]